MKEFGLNAVGISYFCYQKLAKLFSSLNTIINFQITENEILFSTRMTFK
jgi:hypothetical protein